MQYREESLKNEKNTASRIFNLEHVTIICQKGGCIERECLKVNVKQNKTNKIMILLHKNCTANTAKTKTLRSHNKVEQTKTEKEG